MDRDFLRENKVPHQSVQPANEHVKKSLKPVSRSNMPVDAKTIHKRTMSPFFGQYPLAAGVSAHATKNALPRREPPGRSV